MIDQFAIWQPKDWSDFILLYISPGLLMVFYLVVAAIKDRPTKFARGVIKALGKDISFSDQIKEIGVYIAAVSCVLIGWPGFLIWFIKNKRDEAKSKAWKASELYESAREYLMNPITPGEAELMGAVYDPLGKAPNLPFGHLNKAWVAFLSEMIHEGDELWTFEVPRGANSGKYAGYMSTSGMRGFARVNDGKVMAEFIVESQ